MHRRPALPVETVEGLTGLGPVSAALLAGLGVRDAAALRARDAVTLYLALKAQSPGTSMNLLYALIGAQEGVDWRVIAGERRSALLTELDARQQSQQWTRP